MNDGPRSVQRAARRQRSRVARFLALLLAAAAAAWGMQTDHDHHADRPAVSDPGPSPTLGAAPPMIDEKTIVLFDGSSWAGWHDRRGEPSSWPVQDDGSVMVTDGHAISDLRFTDCRLHIEFLCPRMEGRTGQARANSGVYLHGRYEVQVLDSFGDEPAINRCGAIYSIAPPLVAVSRPPETWQTYDIIFRAPRFDESGEMTAPAYMTVLQNGIVVHNHQEVSHTTTAAMDEEMVPAGPLMLQDHGCPVRYRNIWLRKLD
ncbi:MAG: DUF1080 domain-containing protein [Planctomycetota bacterium]|nr:DUF1080 domain-containing protein [Planctomycetota bacterium]